MKEHAIVIDHVLANNDIAKFLADNGHEHQGEMGDGRYKYRCPLPDHNDSSPSFYVYPPTEKYRFPTFHCFGCGKRGNIIKLAMLMGRLSGKDAIDKLKGGLSFSVDDVIAYEAQRMDKDRERERDAELGHETGYALDELSFMLGRTMHQYMQATKFDEPYFSRAEGVFKLIDDCVDRNDLSKLEKLWLAVPDRLGAELRKYEQDTEREADETARVYSAM